MIHSHKWAARVADAGLGVSCKYEKFSRSSMRSGNKILIEFSDETVRNMER